MGKGERFQSICISDGISCGIDLTPIPSSTPLVGPRAEQLDLTSLGMGDDY